MKEQTLEVNSATVCDATKTRWPNLMVMSPDVKANWIARVRLSDEQAIIAFPKFGTVGVGFEVEAKDWNTNLPTSCDAAEIYDHIKVNKGSRGISKAACIRAIQLVSDYANEWKAAQP